jgi:hypothetical protein
MSTVVAPTLALVAAPCAQGCGLTRLNGVESRIVTDTSGPVHRDRRLTTVTVMAGCPSCDGVVTRLR